MNNAKDFQARIGWVWTREQQGRVVACCRFVHRGMKRFGKEITIFMPALKGDPQHACQRHMIHEQKWHVSLQTIKFREEFPDQIAFMFWKATKEHGYDSKSTRFAK